jgi:hypothetical protein
MSILEYNGVEIPVDFIFERMGPDDFNRLIKMVKSYNGGFVPSNERLNYTERKFQKACWKLQENRHLIPKEIEEKIIEFSEKYTI